jgi:carbon-monoxide dehydrogenase medium subunit
VKAPGFAYARPRSVAEAIDLLERHGQGARILAGGQSLLPSLNLRLSSPELLVDIGGIAELSGIALDQDVLRIGALATHAQIGSSEAVRKHVPLLAQAVPHIAHAAIRNRGTLGGSLALADPAAEYPACVLALEATLVVQGAAGERLVPAEGFFKGLFETDLRAAEILTAVEFPALRKDERSVFMELARRQGDYAIVGLAAHQRGEALRLAFLGAGATPVLAKHAAAAARGGSIAQAQAALPRDLAPPADLYHSSAAKLHLARVLLGRALEALWNTK